MFSEASAEKIKWLIITLKQINPCDERAKNRYFGYTDSCKCRYIKAPISRLLQFYSIQLNTFPLRVFLVLKIYKLRKWFFCFVFFFPFHDYFLLVLRFSFYSLSNWPRRVKIYCWYSTTELEKLLELYTLTFFSRCS